MKSLQDLAVFVRAIEAGSLSAAARTLGITPAAASAALKRLEAEVGVPLVERTTRSLRLTAAGERFLGETAPALEALLQAGQRARTGEQSLAGRLHLGAPSDLGRHALLDWLDAFCEAHPGVDVHLHLTDRPAGLHRERVDAALHYGAPSDASLVAVPLQPRNRRVLCAAQDYLDRHGAPATPQDLAQHACLRFLRGDEPVDRWHFLSREEGASPITVRVRGRWVADDADVLRRWAVQGRGIAYASALDIAQDVALRRLTVLCPAWDTEALPLMFVLPADRVPTPLVRALQAYLAGQVMRVPIESIAHSGGKGRGSGKVTGKRSGSGVGGSDKGSGQTSGKDTARRPARGVR